MAKSKLVKANEKIAEAVTDGYKKIEKVSWTVTRKSNMALLAAIPSSKISLLMHTSQKRAKP